MGAITKQNIMLNEVKHLACSSKIEWITAAAKMLHFVQHDVLLD